MAMKTKGQVPSRLDDQIEKFVHEYWKTLKDGVGNGTLAAERAGYSKGSAKKKAYDLLRKPEVQAALDQLRARERARRSIERDWLLRKLRRIIEFDPGDVFDVEDGALKLRPKEEWPKQALRFIAISSSASESSGKEGHSSSRSISFRHRDSLHGTIDSIARLLGYLNDKPKPDKPDREDTNRRVLELLRKRKSR